MNEDSEPSDEDDDQTNKIGYELIAHIVAILNVQIILMFLNDCCVSQLSKKPTILPCFNLPPSLLPRQPSIVSCSMNFVIRNKNVNAFVLLLSSIAIWSLQISFV